jgi:hypothetical protein
MRPASITTVCPVIVSVRHMVTTMSAQSSLSAGFFRSELEAERSTRDVGTSSFAQGCAGQITAVEVERFNGNLPPIRAFDAV